jgi:hypothetical protein
MILSAKAYENIYLMKYIPYEKYLILSNKQQKISLCSQSLDMLDHFFIQKRIEQLEHLEKIGFVYESEKKWLLNYLDTLKNHKYPEYSLWIRHVFITQILKKPLKWGSLEDEQGHTSERFQNVWCGKIEKTEIFPVFRPLKTSNCLKVLSTSHCFEIEILGSKKSPNNKALVNAFEFLHNLPYYAELAKDRLLDPEYDLSLEGISSEINETNDVLCDLIYASEYAYGMSITFKNRKRENLSPSFSNKIAFIKKMIEPYNLPKMNECFSFKKNEEYCSNKDLKILFEHLSYFSKKEYERVIRFFLNEKIWMNASQSLMDHIPSLKKLTIFSFSTLEGCDIDCKTCSSKYKTDLSFHWGIKLNYPHYKQNDPIQWGVQNCGANIYDELFIEGQALTLCVDCNEKNNQCFIHVKKNRMIGYTKKNISPFQYSRIYISKEWIPIKTFERNYFKQKVNQCCHRIDDPLLIELAALIKQKNSSKRHKHSINIKRYFYIMRYYFDISSYLRICQYFQFKFYSSHNKALLNYDSKIKSCCILKNIIIDDQMSDYVFYWGTLLNFQEYKLGDSIIWSEYSVGEKNIKNIYLVAHSLKPISLKYQTIKIYLKNGILSSISTYMPQDSYFSASDMRIAYEYSNNAPYLTWKERYLMRY